MIRTLSTTLSTALSTLSTLSTTLALGLAGFTGLAMPALAQEERELDTPTGYSVYSGIDAAAVNTHLGNGLRLLDLEVRSASPLLFTATFVPNSGEYASGFWWYYGLTSAQVSSYLSTNSARLIDLEPYDAGGGALRFAAVMVPNSGPSAKTWWWYFGQTPATISTHLSTNNARLIDLDQYEIGGNTYHSAVMIRNTGADARTWWWYYNVSAAQVGSYCSQNQARLIDLERRDNGNYDCVMQRDPQPTSWYWALGLTLGQIIPFLDDYGQRPIDVETYVVSGTRYYDVVGIRNTDATTAQILGAMHVETDGTMGAYLKRMNGSVLHGFNTTRQFEPASTMKTLHHVHAMRQVMLGNIGLATPVNVFTGMSGSCPQDTGAISESLQTVLRRMMENSDNARTQAVTALFGQAAINATANALGMGGTDLNHRLGCAGPAIASPNQTTLGDLGELHEDVVQGFLGGFRDTFYALMLDNVNDLTVGAIIDQEGASLGIPAATVTTFRAFTRMAHKGGNYSLSSGGPSYFHRAEFGWISLPFVVGGNLVDQEYAFGAFVNAASVDDDARDAIYDIALPQLLRPRIRAALQTWTGALAAVQSFGPGCGSPTPYAQTVLGLPRIGTTPTYRASAGYANSLAAFGIGFSDEVWGRVALPASVMPFGGEAGCMALCSVDGTEAAVASASGVANFALAIPNNTGLLGLQYFTQCYTFGTGSFRTSNAVRSLVGL